MKDYTTVIISEELGRWTEKRFGEGGREIPDPVKLNHEVIRYIHCLLPDALLGESHPCLHIPVCSA